MAEKDARIEKQKFLPQLVAATGVLLMYLQNGIMTGWMSPNMVRLTSPASPIPALTLAEASWVASSLSLGRLVGAFLVPLLVEFLGSKRTILATFLLICASWTATILADGVEWLYAARALGGACFAIVFGCSPLYLGEISAPEHRGTLISFSYVGYHLGNVMGGVGETYLRMGESSAVYLGLCAVGIGLFLWLPESPHYLVKRGDDESAGRSILWYGGHEVETKLRETKAFVECNSRQSFAEKLEQFRSPAIRRALLIIFGLYTFLELCGVFSVMFYMETILMKAESRLVEPKQAVICANLAALVAATLALRLSDKLGRRALLTMSSLGTALALTCLGLHFHLLDLQVVESRDIQWLALASLITFSIAFNVGLSVVPTTMLSELFPSNLRSVAASLASVVCAIGASLSTKSYQPLVEGVGEAGTFWIHAAITALAVPFALFYMIETKGKSLQEIQDELCRRVEKS